MQRALPTIVGAGLLACALAGCGGGDTPTETTWSMQVDPVATLLDDQGQAMPSSIRPADAGAWTANGRYATVAQAESLRRSLGDAAIQVQVACCGESAVAEAAGMAWALQAAHDLPSAQARVLVGGPDLRLAAATANRLIQGGLRDVWLVVPAT